MAAKHDGFDYKSPRWLRARERALRRCGYECQESKRYGLKRPATVVHHVWPVEQWPEFAWCEWNHLPLTAEAHDQMHDRTTGKLTPLGESWRRRVSPPPDRREKND